jgi:hypothetical protein
MILQIVNPCEIENEMRSINSLLGKSNLEIFQSFKFPLLLQVLSQDDRLYREGREQRWPCGRQLCHGLVQVWWPCGRQLCHGLVQVWWPHGRFSYGGLVEGPGTVVFLGVWWSRDRSR